MGDGPEKFTAEFKDRWIQGTYLLEARAGQPHHVTRMAQAHPWLARLARPYAAPHARREQAHKRALWLALFTPLLGSRDIAQALYHTWGREGALCDPAAPALIQRVLAATWGPVDAYLALAPAAAAAVPLAALVPTDSTVTHLPRLLACYPALLDWLWCYRARASWRARRGPVREAEVTERGVVRPLLAGALRRYVDDDASLPALVERAVALRRRIRSELESMRMSEHNNRALR